MDASDGLTPYWLPPGSGTPLPNVGTVKASAKHTGGSFEVIESVGSGGPPPHVHREREEAFYVLEGALNFVLGDDRFEAGPGSFVFVPRGTRHGFQATPGTRALFFIAPAGLEGFFRALGEGIQQGRSNQEIRASLAGVYDSEPV